jgi:hypothetical protein
MEFDIRKILVIFAVAILFTLFSYALFDAFYPQLKYEDYCVDKPYVEFNDAATCEAAGGKWNPDMYRPVKEVGPIGYCDINYYCNKDFEEANKQRNFYAFIILAIMGGIAILIGLYLPIINPINEWVGTGFMLGGLFDIFFGTAMNYQDLGRFLKPAVLFIELALVIFLTYKKLGVTSLKIKKKR